MVVNSSNGIASTLVINARYKRYNLQQKREFIEEASQAGSSISIVARKYGLAPSVLFNWRHVGWKMGGELLVGLGTGEDLKVAASQVKELKNKIRELERLLGRKTVEVEILKEAVEVGREKKLISRASLAGRGRFQVKTISMVLGVSRSNLADRLTGARAEPVNLVTISSKICPEILPDIRAICTEKPSYGYRRVTALLNRKYRAINAPILNHKRVYRLMRQNQLLLQKHTGRPTRTHDGKVVTLKSNLRWSSDTFNIRSFNGEKVEVAFSLDTCDREVISYIATESATTGEMIRDLMAVR